jgi:hypothetical protein
MTSQINNSAARKASLFIAQLKAEGKFNQACAELEIPPEPPEQFWRVNRGAVLWLREFVRLGGLTLTPSYWILESGAQKAVVEALELALCNGWDASKASAKFIYEGPANDVIKTQVYGANYKRVDELFLKLLLLAHQS